MVRSIVNLKLSGVFSLCDGRQFAVSAHVPAFTTYHLSLSSLFLVFLFFRLTMDLAFLIWLTDSGANFVKHLHWFEHPEPRCYTDLYLRRFSSKAVSQKPRPATSHVHVHGLPAPAGCRVEVVSLSPQSRRDGARLCARHWHQERGGFPRLGCFN